MNASVAAVIAALVVGLAAIGLLTGDGEQPTEPARGERPRESLSVERVARRVERIRELEFERLPRVRRVSAEQARAAVLTEYDHYVPRSQ